MLILQFNIYCCILQIVLSLLADTFYDLFLIFLARKPIVLHEYYILLLLSADALGSHLKSRKLLYTVTRKSTY